MIVLLFPDGSSRRLHDDAARQLADDLWDIATGARTANVAVSIRYELQRHITQRATVDVPERNAVHVAQLIDLRMSAGDGPALLH